MTWPKDEVEREKARQQADENVRRGSWSVPVKTKDPAEEQEPVKPTE